MNEEKSGGLEIETLGLEPIPAAQQAGNPRSLLGLWWGGQFTYISLVIGSIPILLGLSWWGAFTAILVGGLLGSIAVGLSGFLGPQTHTGTIVNTRALFGIKGNLPWELLNWITVAGWVGANTVLAGLALIQLAGLIGLAGTGIKILAVLIVLAAQVVIAIFGIKAVLSSERIFAIVTTILVLALLAFVLPKMDFAFAGSGLTGNASWGTWLLAVAIVFTGPLSWVNYGSDYTRYYPQSTKVGQIFKWAFLGMFIPTLISYPIGAALATTVDMSNPVNNLPAILPTWFLAPFLFIVIWSCIANNVLNTYTAGLALLALHLKVKRWLSVVLIGIIAAVFCYYAIFVYDFTPIFQQFLQLQMIWLAPWVTLMLMDFVYRREHYDVQGLHLWGKGSYWYNNGFNWAGLAIMIIAILVSLPFANSTLFSTAFARDVMGGADISYFVGIIVAVLLYLVYNGLFQKNKPMKSESE
jgi:nucleobase:cation symporter-1, NCS1 family